MAYLVDRLSWAQLESALKAWLGISGSTEDAWLAAWTEAAIEAADRYLDVDWPDDSARKVQWEITGIPTDGDLFSISINGIESTHTASADTAADVAAALRAAMTTALAAEDVTVGGATVYATVAANTAGIRFTDQHRYVSAAETAAAGMAETELAPNYQIPSGILIGLYEFVGGVRLQLGSKPGLTSVKTGQLSETYAAMGGKTAAQAAGMLAAMQWWRPFKRDLLTAGGIG